MSAVPGLGSSEAGATLTITHECNNRCVFCCREGLPDRPRPPLDEALRAARSTADRLTFVGGEPTLSPELDEAVERAVALGFRAVGIQTNAAQLSPSRARSLARAGLTDVQLSIHGATADVHDYHSGSVGSFDVCARALASARDAGLRVTVTTVVTRSSFRTLSALPAWLAARGVAAWLLSFARHAGRAAAARDRVLPRLAMAAPYALRAVALADSRRLPALVMGAPLCLLGPFASRAAPELARAFPVACSGCPSRPSCPGVDAAYLARFGGDELAHVDPVPRDPRVAPFVGLFAGPGDRVEPPPPPAPPPRSLPMFGKVRRAHAEAAPGGDRRSGEALREIFPDLFEAGGGREPDDA